MAFITSPAGMGGVSSGIVNVEITGYDDVAVTSFDLTVDAVLIGNASTNPATIV